MDEQTNDGVDESASGPPPSRLRTIRRYVARPAAWSGLLGAVVFTVFLLKPQYSGNIGIIDAGRVIRSAQPTARLRDMIRDYKLASILNLRGGSPQDFFYSNEVQAAGEAGVDFYDVSMSATRRPRRSDLLRLISVVNHCEYPLLIHCKAGADRTGLATAIYRLVILKEPPEQAIGAFTLYHSHIPLFGPEKLHEPIDEYAAWLSKRAQPHTPERFHDWVLNTYQAGDPSVEPPPVAPGSRRPL